MKKEYRFFEDGKLVGSVIAENHDIAVAAAGVTYSHDYTWDEIDDELDKSKQLVVGINQGRVSALAAIKYLEEHNIRYKETEDGIFVINGIELSEKEKRVLVSWCMDAYRACGCWAQDLEYDNYSWITPADLVNLTGFSKHQIAGILGSLLSKGAIDTDSNLVEQIVTPNPTGEFGKIGSETLFYINNPVLTLMFLYGTFYTTFNDDGTEIQ